jgi:hypothetical protein
MVWGETEERDGGGKWGRVVGWLEEAEVWFFGRRDQKDKAKVTEQLENRECKK